MKIINKEVNINTEYLSLSFFEQIKVTELEKISQLKKLKHLNLSNSYLFDKHLEIIRKVASLELLDLDATEITDSGLQYLKPLNKLKELRLKDNPQLTDACIEHLLDIKDLELIHFGNTAVTTSGVRVLLENKKIKTLILDSEFKDNIYELKSLSEKHPYLEIIVKETGIISNGKLD